MSDDMRIKLRAGLFIAVLGMVFWNAGLSWSALFLGLFAGWLSTKFI